MTKTEYLSCAETAKLLRATLKAQFPGVKFSVRSSTYSGGASIDVGWTDGPREDEVKPYTELYRGATFDGMTDMKSYQDSIIGTGDDVKIVHFGADFVFTNRTSSPEAIAQASQSATLSGRVDRPTQCEGCGNWMEPGDVWVAHSRRDGRPWVYFTHSQECAGRIMARCGISTDEECYG